jgi:protein-S-isoprenylcysteine O-methyltransferase Ste14
MLKRAGGTVFAAVAYLAFAAVSAYSVAFVAGAGVPRTIDGGGPRAGHLTAAVFDAALLSLFAVQHSVMARSGFKRWLTRVVPAPAERSCYVLASSGVLALTFWQWRPIATVIWDVHYAPARAALWIGYGLSWCLVVAMTYAIDHWELFGLGPVLREIRGRRPAAPEFRLPVAYRLVRHPMMTGFILAFAVTPHMTVGHLLFAALSTSYVLVAVRLEERELAATLPQYAHYAARTPRFFPRPGRLYAPEPVSTGRDPSAPHCDHEPV